jgi:hypothetical protein
MDMVGFSETLVSTYQTTTAHVSEVVTFIFTVMRTSIIIFKRQSHVIAFIAISEENFMVFHFFQELTATEIFRILQNKMLKYPS